MRLAHSFWQFLSGAHEPHLAALAGKDPQGLGFGKAASVGCADPRADSRGARQRRHPTPAARGWCPLPAGRSARRPAFLLAKPLRQQQLWETGQSVIGRQQNSHLWASAGPQAPARPASRAGRSTHNNQCPGRLIACGGPACAAIARPRTLRNPARCSLHRQGVVRSPESCR